MHIRETEFTRYLHRCTQSFCHTEIISFRASTCELYVHSTFQHVETGHSKRRNVVPAM